MSTCRCGAWVGHPEARACTVPDCELRRAEMGTDNRAVDDRRDQRASDCEAEGSVGGGEAAGVHEQENARVAA